MTPLSDDTFGATVSKLIDVTAQYYECRTAALAGYRKQIDSESANPSDRK